METYSEFQNELATEKVGLVAVQAGLRLMGWSSYSGHVYSVPFAHQVIVSIAVDGTEYTASASLDGVVAGSYFHDRQAGYIYVWTADSSHPNGLYIACVFKFFFANCPIKAPHNLDDGYEVPWLPLLKTTSQFGVEIDNTNLLGYAIEGSGNITLFNDRDFWASVYDKYVFENQLVQIYSWSSSLPITEAKLIYSGRTTGKQYTNNSVTFSLQDQLSALRSKLNLGLMGDVVGAKIPGTLNNAKQRLLFGYVKGHRPTNIDQMLDLTGYTLTGTVAVTSGSQTVTGTSTSFLSELSPGDEILMGSDTTKYAIQSIASNTSLTITEAYEGTTRSGLALRITGTQRGKRYMNRTFLVGGHALKEPTTTVTRVYSLSTFDVADPTDFIAGEPIVINSENLEIERVSGSRITLVLAAANLSVGDIVTIPSVRNVYINNRLLTNIDDYTYDAETAILELDPLAEFSVAPTRSLTGTLAYTSSSRTVTGTSTFFKKELASGDWIRRANESDWFEILSVDSDTQVTLRTASTYTSTGASYNKQPDIYLESRSVLSCDVLGATEDGTTTGTFLNDAPRIVKYLLSQVGMSDLLDTDSFDEVDEVTTPYLGFVVPARMNDTDVPTVRDIINTVNQSVFGTLFQTQEFLLAYSILTPRRPSSMIIFRQGELLDWSIKSDSSNLTSTVKVEYLTKEYDVESGAPSTQVATNDSELLENFTDIRREKTFSTYLVDSEDAERYTKRWTFILETPNSTLNFSTGMRASRLEIAESVHVQHEKFYERYGSALARRVGMVSALKRDASRSSLEMDDVGGAFSRVATIADDDTSEWSDATDDEKFINGFITDEYGMIDNDPETFGINLIW